MRKLICNCSHFSSSKSGFFFIFGAPGVGKGTYASMLVKDLGLSHISTGDEIRKFLKSPPDSAKEVEVIREIVRSGGLISDDTVLRMI
jgi:adenylate kinase